MKNYRQIIAIKEANKKKLLEMCPKLSTNSGIYLWARRDTNGIVWTYVGQAVNILERSLQHMTEYYRLGLSIRKRGFYSSENPNGWKLVILEECPEDMLDAREQYWILTYMKKGCQSYNNTSGSQGSGKEIYNASDKKGYNTGKTEGYTKAIEDIRKYLKYCEISPKAGKLAQKQYEKLLEILNS